MPGRFRACYGTMLSDDPTFTGALTLVAEIGPHGEVVRVTGSGKGFDARLTCFVSVVRAAAFTPPSTGTATITIPLSCTPQ